MRPINTLLIILLVWPAVVLSQKKDSLPTPYHWNVISINPTPAFLFDNPKNISLRYERMVKPNQSFLVQLGFLELNPIFGDSVGGFIDIKRVSDIGVNAAFDYRFYPLRRNQYPAPDGLYLGPYLSYYGFKFKDEFAYFPTDTVSAYGSYSSNYHLVNLGFMIGYQFIFWKRLSVDLLIFGPSLTYMVSDWTVSDNLPEEDEMELVKEIKEKFNERYPLLVPFIQPNDGRQSASVRMFFRYSISVGFHF